VWVQWKRGWGKKRTQTQKWKASRGKGGTTLCVESGGVFQTLERGGKFRMIKSAGPSGEKAGSVVGGKEKKGGGHPVTGGGGRPTRQKGGGEPIKYLPDEKKK